jgi:hypothetical protein
MFFKKGKKRKKKKKSIKCTTSSVGRVREPFSFFLNPFIFFSIFMPRVSVFDSLEKPMKSLEYFRYINQNNGITKESSYTEIKSAKQANFQFRNS